MPQFQYKQQQFQQDAVNAVADAFNGIDFSFLRNDYEFQLANEYAGNATAPTADDTAESPPNFILSNFRNELETNLKDIQARNNIQPTLSLEEEYLMLDTHMETGTGKTFAFINTIFELHKRYGLTHFVVIVPSIAIKEGIKKSFETTATYFENLYQQRIEVYEMKPAKNKKGRKSLPGGVMSFVYAQQLTVLIMTNHSFNRTDNIINQELESFYADNARTPMDAIAAKNPVLIIDEPQRVEGRQTAERIKNFSPLFVLRYSATFREGQIKNLVYVLDSYDAFNQKLVKGITVTDYKVDSTDSAFLGVRRISTKNNKLIAELVAADKAGESKTIITGKEKENSAGKIFEKTGNAEYEGLRVTKIDNREKTVTFSNGTTIKLGEYLGRDLQNETMIAEVMLRNTIETHLKKEYDLFKRGIKCISLIFIDRVKDYRDYDSGNARGHLQDIFEKCYDDAKNLFLRANNVSADYRQYLDKWETKDVHGGYFSGDTKKNKKIDAGDAIGENEAARKLQQEISELILRDKERVLDPNNKLRFIFAHSALREGWDNPNVFQICKLRSSYSNTNIVQEIGRGLRICVNEKLERQDAETIGNEFLTFNRLDVFTLGNGEFISELQTELNERRNRNKKILVAITVDELTDLYNTTQAAAIEVWSALRQIGCLDENGLLVKKEGLEDALTKLNLDPKTLLKELPDIELPDIPKIGDGHSGKNEPKRYSASETHYERFKELWHLLHQNVIYQVKYSPDFERKIIKKINDEFEMEEIYIHRQRDSVSAKNETITTTGTQETTASIALTSNLPTHAFLNQIAAKTNLPRNTIIRILSKINLEKFEKMKKNPFASITKISSIIEKVIYANIVDNIRYIKQDGLRKSETEITLTDRFSAQHYFKLSSLHEYKDNNLWEEIAPYDSENPEKKISESALAEDKITVFAKLPRAVNIPAPMHPNGINPDFAIVVRRENGDDQLYFVVEAKPTTDTDELRLEEQQRIKLMKKYFEGINANIKFDVVDSYSKLLTLFNESGTVQ